LAERRRASRANDHQRTLSLVTDAAARTGVWPAPRSPLPEALPPPPGGVKNKEKKQEGWDAFGDDDNWQQSAKKTSASEPVVGLLSPSPPYPPPLGLGARNLVFKPPPPPPVNSTTNGSGQRLGAGFPDPVRTSTQPLLVQRQGSAMMSGGNATLAPTPTAKPTPSAKTGGLSAQDLSFFEGL